MGKQENDANRSNTEAVSVIKCPQHKSPRTLERVQPNVLRLTEKLKKKMLVMCDYKDSR